MGTGGARVAPPKSFQEKDFQLFFKLMKFRVWDKMIKKMYLPDTLGAYQFSINLKGDVCNLLNGARADEFVLMQHLENHPDMGDIYEGDIVRIDSYPAWDEERSCVCHFLINNITRHRYDFFGKCSLLGNIYENPTLLDCLK